MTLKLTIQWDGDVPGLAEHELSLSAWLRPMGELLFCLRQITHALARKPEREEKQGIKNTRLLESIRQIDLRIAEIRPGSIDLGINVAVPPPSATASGALELFPQHLLTQGTRRLLEEIDQRMPPHIDRYSPKTNRYARRYLRSLPPGLRRQQYRLEEDGHVIGQAFLGELELPPDPRPLPYVRQLWGWVAGVEFEPKEPTVTIGVEGGRFYRLSATLEQVERALDLRHKSVVVLAAFRADPPKRMLWIREAGLDQPAPRREDLISELIHQWIEPLGPVDDDS